MMNYENIRELDKIIQCKDGCHCRSNMTTSVPDTEHAVLDLSVSTSTYDLLGIAYHVAQALEISQAQFDDHSK